MDRTITWGRLDGPGRETARLARSSQRCRLTGSASFTDQDRHAALEYVIDCDADWRTPSCRVHGSVGDRLIDVRIEVDPAQHWVMNSVESPGVSGCVDIDLNFSPSTNLRPIRHCSSRRDERAMCRQPTRQSPVSNGTLDRESESSVALGANAT